MKKLLLPLLLLSLLLFGCARSPVQPVPAPDTPGPAPVEPPLPTAAPEPLWWEGVTVDDLPAVPAAPEEILAGAQAFYLLSELPEQDIALYGYGGSVLEDADFSGVLLRRGDTLTPFDQAYLPAVEPVLPELWWADFDGDGASELAVKYMIRNHTRSHVFELHFYAPEEGGGWSDCGLTDSDADALLAQQVAYAYDPGSRTITAALPDERVSYRLGDQDPEPAGDAPLCFLDRTFYRYRDGSFTGVYGTGVLLQGLGTPCYFASVTADVRYDGASVSLEHLHLTALGGV